MQKKEKEQIVIIKVVSANFIMDFVGKFQNLFGKNLTAYEQMIMKAKNQIDEQVNSTEMEWYRYEITQLTNGAVAVMFYGCPK